MYDFWVLRTPRPIFQNSCEWLLLEIKAYNYVHLKLRQSTNKYVEVWVLEQFSSQEKNWMNMISSTQVFILPREV